MRKKTIINNASLMLFSKVSALFALLAICALPDSAQTGTVALGRGTRDIVNYSVVMEHFADVSGYQAYALGSAAKAGGANFLAAGNGAQAMKKLQRRIGTLRHAPAFLI